MFDLNSLYPGDCMDYLREIPDKFFELAIVDPPYGDANGVAVYGGHRAGGGG
jgi:site-specific DNA-methyltransferase (adenine-specific)